MEERKRIVLKKLPEPQEYSVILNGVKVGEVFPIITRLGGKGWASTAAPLRRFDTRGEAVAALVRASQS
jgi:hypothetical protein